VKEKVAVATVKGKAYFLIVNALREQHIPFLSVVPGDRMPSEVKVVITTEKESNLINHQRTLVFQSEVDLDDLVDEIKHILEGKDAYEKIIIGVDPGEAIGLAVIADGKVISQDNCFSINELAKNIAKIVKNLDFSFTSVSIKIGNGVPIYREILENLDATLPPQVTLEAVSEVGTNKLLKESRHNRGVRHIASAIRIASRTGYIIPRGKAIATNSRTQ